MTIPINDGKKRGTEVTSLPEPRPTEEDLNYFYNKLLVAKTDEQRKLIRSQIDMLNDCVIIYRLYQPPRQEPLGNEFEKVLYDNLWELYVEDGRNDSSIYL